MECRKEWKRRICLLFVKPVKLLNEPASSHISIKDKYGTQKQLTHPQFNEALSFEKKCDFWFNHPLFGICWFYFIFLRSDGRKWGTRKGEALSRARAETAVKSVLRRWSSLGTRLSFSEPYIYFKYFFKVLAGLRTHCADVSTPTQHRTKPEGKRHASSTQREIEYTLKRDP